MILNRYQNRFIRVGERFRRGGYIVMDPNEIAKWKQYYIDQRARVLLDPELSDSQKKQIREAVAAYEWRENRPILVKEPVNDVYEP